MSRSVASKLFRIVCLSFSAFLLLLCLMCNISLMWTRANIEELHSRISAAERENETLNVRCENRISLSELEKTATERLGMHRPNSEQIFFIELG